jgi:DNA-binding HxlR family transcriptional regulator
MAEDGDVRDAIRDGLTDRVRNLLRGLDRRDRLESATDFAGWLSRQSTAELEDTAREMLLRALRCAADPVNYSILRRLDPMDPVSVPALMSRCGLGRVALSERLNDLAQVGLVSREMIDDQIRATSLALGVRDWAEAIVTRSAEALSDGLGGA